MKDFIPYQVFGVVGYPLGHSLSPLLHTTAFQTLGLPALLTPWALPPDKLPAFIDSVRLLGIKGACVTIPHKQAIMPLLDGLTDRVKEVGAVNTLFWQNNELWGDNTDITGFMAPLQNLDFSPSSAQALILGAGGASRAVVAGLIKMGCRNITITDIAPDQQEALAKDFQITTIDWSCRQEIAANLIINATPLGMAGKFQEQTPYEAAWFKGRPGLAYDLVYNPKETIFLKTATSAGWQTIIGLDMFLAQAEAQFLIWSGGHALPIEAKKATAAALGL